MSFNPVTMDILTSSLIVVSIAWICIQILSSDFRARKSSKLPPGPYGLPIIGNILHLGSNPHRSLAKLARKYGPVMSLKLGSVTTVVFSSPETAKLVLQKHDASFSSRTIPSASKALRHDEFSMVWLPVGEQWRKLRKICKEHMFSTSRLDASEGLRREKLQKLRDYVGECCETGRAVDVGEAAFTTSLNLMSASLFSVEFGQFNSDSSQEMKDVVWGVMESVGRPNLADYFPVLKFADPQRILKGLEFYVGKLIARFDEIIDERLKSRGEKHDLVEVLIDLHQKDGAQLSRDDIKHLLLRQRRTATTTATPLSISLFRLGLGVIGFNSSELCPAKRSQIRHCSADDEANHPDSSGASNPNGDFADFPRSSRALPSQRRRRRQPSRFERRVQSRRRLFGFDLA